MAIIKRKKGNATHVYEVIYEGIENGKRKYKWKLKYKLDENGNLIPSKRKTPKLPTENQEEVKAIAVLEQSTENQKPEVFEAQIVNDEQQEFQQVISKRASQYKMGISKLDNTIFSPSKNPAIYEKSDINQVKIKVSRENSQKKRIETLLYIDFNDAKQNGFVIPYEEYITPYDREIHNAVATLASAGNQYISPSMIFQLLSGYAENDGTKKNNMSNESREKIIKSLEKMRFTSIKIDATAEVKQGMIAEGIIESYLIPAKRVEIILNGQRVTDCIQLLDTLPLLKYSNQKNQIASVDIKMLKTPLINSPENIEIKCYLLRQILSMSNSKNNITNVIRYDSLYDYLKIQAPNKNQLKKKHKKIRDKVKKLLDFWKKDNNENDENEQDEQQDVQEKKEQEKEEERLIKNYKEEKEGRCLAKIIIYFPS